MSIYCDVNIGDKKMTKCVECGRKLGITEGYRHPTMGKKQLLCSTCFDRVMESTEHWREFITPYNNFFRPKHNVENHFDIIKAV